MYWKPFKCGYIYVRTHIQISNSNPIIGQDRPWGFQEVEAPRFQDNRYMKVVRLSDLHTGRFHAEGNIPDTHFCQRLNRPQGHSATGRIMSMKNSNDTMGNRIRNIPDCSVVTGYEQPEVHFFATAVSKMSAEPDSHLDCLHRQQSDRNKTLLK